MPDSHTVPQAARSRFVGPVLLAVGLFLLLATVVPLSWSALPLEVSAAVAWLYFAVAALGSSVVAARTGAITERRSAGLAALLVVSLMILTVAGGCHLFDVATQGFGATTTDARVASPSGHLTAVHEHFDQGATGESDSVIVRGRLLPGVVSWAYNVPIPMEGYPEPIAWANDRTLIIDGQRYEIPSYVVRWSW